MRVLALLVVLATLSCIQAQSCHGVGCVSGAGRATGQSGPAADLAPRKMAGPAGSPAAARQIFYTVDGVMSLDCAATTNLLDKNASPSGCFNGLSGVFNANGNCRNVNGPTGVTLAEDGQPEFCSAFISVTGVGGSGAVGIDIDPVGNVVTVTRGAGSPSNPASAALITLTSDYFKQFDSATRIEVQPAKRVDTTTAAATANTPAGGPVGTSSTQATLQQSAAPNGAISFTSLQNGVLTLAMDTQQWATFANREQAAFQLTKTNTCQSGLCCSPDGSHLNGTICRQKSACAAEARCNGVDADCPATGVEPNGHHCSWSPPHKLPKHSYSYRPYSNNDGSKTEAQTSGYDSDDWEECDGVCMEGICALRWESPRCCYIAGHNEPHHYHQQDGYEGGRPYASSEAQAAAEEADNSAVTANTMSGYYYQAGDLYCRN